MVRRTEIAAVFSAAKVKLARNESDINHSVLCDYSNEFICLAIDDTNASWSAREAAKRVIAKRLGKNNTVECYVRDTLGIHSSVRTTNDMQEFRHRWVDSLIAEYSK